MTTESFANDPSNQGTTESQFKQEADQANAGNSDAGNQLQQQIDVMQKRLTDKDEFIETLKTENQSFREQMADFEAKLQSMGTVDEAVARMQEASKSNQDTTLDEDQLIGKALSRFKEETALEQQQRIAKENFTAVSETLTKTYGADKVDAIVTKAAEEAGLSFDDMIKLAEKSPQAVYKMVGVNSSISTANPSTGTNVGYASDNQTKEQKLAYYSRLRKENPKEYAKPEVQKAFRELCLSKD